MNKAWIIGLAGLSIILAGTTILLALMLYQRPRFTSTNGRSPYVMFDTRTAQACWSGPPDAPAPRTPEPLGKNGFDWNKLPVVEQDKNPPNLPFCKDLK